MKKRIAGGVLLVCVMGGLLLEFMCRTRVWAYPNYVVSEDVSDTTLYWYLKLGVALLATLTAIAALSRFDDDTWGGIGITLVWIFCFLPIGFIWPQKGPAYIISYVQECVIALYVLLCWYIADWVKEHVRPWNAAHIMFFVIHLLIVSFCSWSTFYGEFYPSVPTVIWMAFAFALIYREEYWPKLKGLARWRQAAFFIGMIAVHLVLFNPARLVQIFQTFVDGSAPSWNTGGVSWWLYRLGVLKAHITGAYPQAIKDPLALGALVHIPLVWLGIAFGTRLYQMIYVALVAVSLLAIWQLYRESDYYRSDLLILGVFASNVWGLICSFNLFWSSSIGPLTSVNAFQLIPLILLIVWAFTPELECTYDPSDDPTAHLTLLHGRCLRREDLLQKDAEQLIDIPKRIAWDWSAEDIDLLFGELSEDEDEDLQIEWPEDGPVSLESIPEYLLEPEEASVPELPEVSCASHEEEEGTR